MESQGSQELVYYYPDAETELAAVDDFIYMDMLAELNAAKIAYNLIADPRTDDYTRQSFIKKYFDILKAGNLVNPGVLLRKETYAKRPQVALIKDHACHLTIALLRQMKVFDEGGNVDTGFILWVNERVNSELAYLKEFNAAIREAQSGGFAKNESEA
ncbi:MAG: hypothetical protein NTZ25_02160 [Candidatus Peregrinibacteria bacterium]|nr:hypothetical protein [Candidatus Peregrinibacteria bacterium]